jgi:two-component system phosphate regulon sensor histidine kinase PhoR
MGLIAIQIYWIKNSIALRDTQFKRNVKMALAETNKILEREEKMYRLKQHDFGKVMLEFDSLKSGDQPGRNLYFGNEQKQSDTTRFFNSEGNFAFELQKDKISADYLFGFDPQEGRAENAQGTREESAFTEQQTKEIAKLLFDIATLQYGDDFLSRASTTYIDSLLRLTLTETGGIRTDFHFGLFDRYGNPQALPERSENEVEKLLKKGYKTRLLPQDYITQTTLLRIWFPNQDSYLLRTLWPLLVSSGLFTLAIIFTFTYTIRTILRQKKVSEIKNDFINNITHELKTPISTISLACEALSDPVMAAKTNKVGQYVGMIKDENKRLGVLVEDVLKNAVLNRGEMNLSYEEVDMHEVIESAIKSIRLQASQNQGNISSSLNAKQHVIGGDKIHLTNVIYNLLDNAIKYSNGQPDIHVSTRSNKKSMFITVADKGVGIKKEDQKRIFEKLYRVPTGDVHDVKGYGLGLSYVKSIVEKHNGTASVHSEIKKGSKFTIQLPYNYDIKNKNTASRR